MRHVYQTFFALAILMVAIIAGAGAINYFAKGEGIIYLIAGIINVIGGIYLAYRKAKNIHYKEK